MQKHMKSPHGLASWSGMTVVMFAIMILVPGGQLAAGLVQQQPAPEPPPSETPASDLPWQPGLGQPIRNVPVPEPASASPSSGMPAQAFPLPNAQPIPTSDQQSGDSVPPQANWPVVPAAFLQEAGASPTQPQAPVPNPGNPTTGNPNLVDAGITTVTRGMDSLPNSAGQIWRTYDISPYTYNVPNTKNPEQAVIDWIIKETGTEMWFMQPLGILNASGNQLHVYHTPEVQDRIKPIVDRFVSSRGAAQVLGLRLMTIASPDWRRLALTMMKPVPIDSPGVEAWLMSKENAAVLAGQLRNRADFQEHSNGDLVLNDGQKFVLSNTRPVEFIRSLTWVNQAAGYYQPLTDRVDEGYSIDFSALSSLDGQTIEAIIGCKIDQIEKLQSVMVQVPVSGGPSQNAELQVPQMVSWRISERFRWPSDQVLVLGCGVVATPGPQREALLGIPSLFNGTRRRAEALMFVEYKGKAASGPMVPAPATANSGQMMPINPNR